MHCDSLCYLNKNQQIMYVYQLRTLKSLEKKVYIDNLVIIIIRRRVLQQDKGQLYITYDLFIGYVVCKVQ